MNYKFLLLFILISSFNINDAQSNKNAIKLLVGGAFKNYTNNSLISEETSKNGFPSYFLGLEYQRRIGYTDFINIGLIYQDAFVKGIDTDLEYEDELISFATNSIQIPIKYSKILMFSKERFEKEGRVKLPFGVLIEGGGYLGLQNKVYLSRDNGRFETSLESEPASNYGVLFGIGTSNSKSSVIFQWKRDLTPFNKDIDNLLKHNYYSLKFVFQLFDF